MYLANVCLVVVPLLFSSIVFRKLEEGSCGGMLVPCALQVEAEPACSMPRADVNLRISTGERHGFSALAPWLNRASPVMYSERAGGSMYS